KNDFIRRTNEVAYDIILNEIRIAASVEKLNELFADGGMVKDLNYDLLPVDKNQDALQNEKNARTRVLTPVITPIPVVPTAPITSGGGNGGTTRPVISVAASATTPTPSINHPAVSTPPNSNPPVTSTGSGGSGGGGGSSSTVSSYSRGSSGGGSS